jgi:hypothetical protein
MTRLRQVSFVGLVLFGTQLSIGCCITRPVFPRVYNVVAGTGACITPIFNRPLIGAPLGAAPVGVGGYAEAPFISGPIYDAPIGAPSAAPCTTCGMGGAGMPMASQPHPYTSGPIVVSKPGTLPPVTTIVPGIMPGTTSSGIPHDSSLIVPTVKPPMVQEMHNESKKLVVAGK